MIILDTNVVSEVMRGPHADLRVMEWLRTLTTTPVTTVINRAELVAAVRLLPEGRRRKTLTRALDTTLSGLSVCLPLTHECTDHYADIVARRRTLGRPIGSMDALIAAIARETGSSLATRDIDDFLGLELTLVDPWAVGDQRA